MIEAAERAHQLTDGVTVEELQADQLPAFAADLRTVLDAINSDTEDPVIRTRRRDSHPKLGEATSGAAADQQSSSPAAPTDGTTDTEAWTGKIRFRASCRLGAPAGRTASGGASPP